MHSASKHDSIHMCEIPLAACEPLYSKCSSDKSLTSIFYSWGPSRPGYHFLNSPCANTSCSVSPVPLLPWEMSTEVIFSPLPWLLHNLSWLVILLSEMVWLHPLVRMGLCHFCFFIFPINSCGSEFRQSSHRHGKSRQGWDSYAEVKPRREWRNQGLIWSQCPQAQTIWQPETDGFTKTIIHHFSPVSNQLAGLLWAAAPLHTVWHIDG